MTALKIKNKEQLLEGYKNSGMSALQYAKKHGINHNTFYGWLAENKKSSKTNKTKPRKFTEERKQQLVKEFLSSHMNKAQFAHKHKLSHGLINSWLKKYNKVQSKQEINIIEQQRIELYEALAKEYKELTTKLTIIHKRMQLIGEQWS